MNKMIMQAATTDDLERLVEATFPELPHEDWLTLAHWARGDGRATEATFLEEAQARWNDLFHRENP